jgi:hypothetical protein
MEPSKLFRIAADMGPVGTTPMDDLMHRRSIPH